MRRFLKGERGAVSVLLIVIVVPVFLFHALLIDVLRLKAAGRASEKALQAAARSVLSRYDSTLQPYGLYAFDSTDEDGFKLLQNIFEQNAAPSGDTGFFRMIDLAPDPGGYGMESMQTLANQAVFRGQLLQEMKVRAPIEYGLAIAQKFKQSGAAAQMSASADFYERSAKLDDLIGRREDALDDAWPNALKFRDETAALRDKYTLRLNRLNELSARIGIKPMTAEGEEIEQRIRDAAEYEALIQMTRLELEVDAGRLRANSDTLAEQVEKARMINAEIETERDRMANVDPPAGAARLPSEDLFRAVPVYPPEYFSAYKTGPGQAVALISGFKAYWPSTFMSGERYDALQQSIDAMAQHSETFISQQEQKEQERRKRNASLSGEKQAQRSKIDEALQGLKSVVGSCGSGSYDALYSRLSGKDGLFAKYSHYNDVADGGGPGGAGFDLDNADKAGKSSMSWMQRFAATALAARDEMYIDEYALTKFGYRTLTQSTDLSQPASRPLPRQEVEYLLYGFGSCTANQFAAYGEMFGALFAIRTAESLTNPVSGAANLGSPLLAFLAAAAQGAAEAVADMERVVAGEAVPIFRKWPNLTVDYKDLLRIFLLMHSNNDKLLARMQAVIELNTGADLTERSTMVRASAKSSIRYWFLPSVMRGLQAGGLLQGSTEKDHFILENFAVLNY